MPLTNRPFVLPSIGKARRSPSFGQVMNAYFENEKWMGSLINRPSLTEVYDPDYDVWEDIPKEYRTADFAEIYSRANGPEDARAITDHLRGYFENQRVLSEAGWGAYLGSMGIMEVFDPLNILIPGPAILHKGLKGYSLARNMLRGAGAAAAAIGIEESILQQAQPMRTGLESAMNISGGALLGGMLGGAAGMLTPKEFTRIQKTLSREINRPLQLYDRIEVTPEGTATIRQPEPVYTMPGQYQVALPTEAKGATVRARLDDALDKGIIDEPVYRLARHITEEIDQTIADDTAIEIIDAVRLATEDEIRREGLAANETYHILGETRKYRDEKDRLQFAIRLYRGADADTLVEEWGHRWWWKMPENSQRVFSRITKTGSPVEAAERFAKGFRDYYFAHKYREEIAGPLAHLFRKAKEVLTDLVRRIKKIRGAKIPQPIVEMFESGMQRRMREMQPERKPFTPRPTQYTPEQLQFYRNEQIVFYEERLKKMVKAELKAEAKAQGIVAGKKTRKEIEALLLDKEIQRLKTVEYFPGGSKYETEKIQIDEEEELAQWMEDFSPGDYQEWRDSDQGIAEWIADLPEDRFDRMKNARQKTRRGREKGGEAEAYPSTHSIHARTTGRGREKGGEAEASIWTMPYEEYVKKYGTAEVIRKARGEAKEAALESALMTEIGNLKSGRYQPKGVAGWTMKKYLIAKLRRQPLYVGRYKHIGGARQHFDEVVQRWGQIFSRHKLGVRYKDALDEGGYVDTKKISEILNIPPFYVTRRLPEGKYYTPRSLYTEIARDMGYDVDDIADAELIDEITSKIQGDETRTLLELFPRAFTDELENKIDFENTIGAHIEFIKGLYEYDRPAFLEWEKSGKGFDEWLDGLDQARVSQMSEAVIEGMEKEKIRPLLQANWGVDSVEELERLLKRRGDDEERIAIILSDYWLPENKPVDLGGGVAFQMRKAEVRKATTMETVAARMEEETDTGSRLMPIRGLSAAASDSIFRWIEHVHPGARPYCARFSNLPGKIAEKTVITWELLNKNKEGKATERCAEIEKRRHITRFSQRTQDSIYTHFINLMKRQRDEEAITGRPGFWQTSRAKLNVSELREFRRRVGMAINELEAGRTVDEFEPEVAAAAREIGAITNEIGRMAAPHGFLGKEGSAKTEAGKPHFAISWNHQVVKKYIGRLATILREDIPEAGNEVIEKILDSVTGSPTGWLDEMDLSQAIDMENIDLWKAEFFRHRDIDIDYRRLIGVEVEPGVFVDFIDMDAANMMKRYVHSVMGPIALADVFGDPTMKKQFKQIYDSYAAKMRGMGDADQTQIRKERDRIFKDMLALRDLVAGTYDQYQTQMFPNAMRISKALMSYNAMKYLGGVVFSSLADVVKPIFRWGLAKSLTGLSDYSQIYRSQEFMALEKEVRETWGAAISAFNSERLSNLMDLQSIEGGTWIERGIGVLADQMGWVTGIDWWNANLKKLSMYVALKDVLEIAEKIQIAGGDIAKADIRPEFITHLSAMGLGVDDLLKVAEQVAQHGERYEKLILPNVQKWTDKEMANRFSAAMVKEIDATISTPSVGDRPLWMHNFILQHAAQFKSFAMNTMRSVIVRGMQEHDSRAMQGILLSAMMGGAIYTLKNAEVGRENTDNPKEFLLNCIDRGGLMAYAMDIDSMANRLTRGTFSLQSLIGGEGSTRFSAKSNWDILAGPTAGTVDDIGKLLSRTIPHAVGDKMVQSDIAPIFRMIPYAKTPWLRWLMERWREDWKEQLPVRLEEED